LCARQREAMVSVKTLKKIIANDVSLATPWFSLKNRIGNVPVHLIDDSEEFVAYVN
jgi:hypothetical protein